MSEIGYLQVVVIQSGPNLFATSVNGESLVGSSGCLVSLFSGDLFPYAADYFRYLESEGWQLVSSNTTFINKIVYTFRGGYGYRIRWEGGEWHGEENRYVAMMEDY